MSSDSLSFNCKTPEYHHQPFPDALNVCGSEDWLLRNNLSSSTASRVQSEEQDENVAKSWNVTNLHFPQRDWLEMRLEELQKDVASLILKLRATGDRSMTLNVSSFLATSKDRENELKSLKTSGIVEGSRKGMKEQLSRAARAVNSPVEKLKELHDVTMEKNQLKFELEKTKRALAVARKSRKAYDKLKECCDSLQELLDLSERNRMRQRKLLQQLQVQQQERATKKEGQKMISMSEGKTRPKSAEKISLCCTSAAPSRQEVKRQQDGSFHEWMHMAYDAMDSFVASADQQDEDANTDLDTHEQAPSEPTAASRSKKPNMMLKPTTPTAKQPDFDSLLESGVPQFSTRRPSRIATNNTQQTSQKQVQHDEEMRQAARWGRSQVAADDVSTSTTQKVTRDPHTTLRPKNSYLAHTQASLRRLRNLPRRDNHDRPPFVV